MRHREKAVKYLAMLLIAAAVLLSGALLTPPSRAQSGDEGSGLQVLEGVVSDGMCGVSHSGRDPAECTITCVRNGMGWVLVVGDKVYTLEGRLGRGMNVFAGKQARVTGTVDGNTIFATQVDAAS